MEPMSLVELVRADVLGLSGMSIAANCCEAGNNCRKCPYLSLIRYYGVCKKVCILSSDVTEVGRRHQYSTLYSEIGYRSLRRGS